MNILTQALQGPVSVGHNLLPEIDNFADFGYQLLKVLQEVGIVLAVIFLIISGYMYLTARGSDDQIEKAKKATQFTVMGIVILSTASIIVTTITQSINPTGFDSAPIVTLADHIVGILYSVVMVITVLFLIISGFQFITARGDEEQIGKAKKSVMFSVIGLVIMNLAYLVVGAFFAPENGEIVPRIDANKMVEIIVQVSKVLLSVVGFIAILLLIFNGFSYITSRGEEEQMNKAKSGIVAAIIGLVIIVFSYSLVSIVFRIGA